jgi:hypothetical protein
MAHLILDGGWKITTVVDGDFHLTVYISNEDESPVSEIEEELGNQPQEIGVRFTTENIENEYKERL